MGGHVAAFFQRTAYIRAIVASVDAMRAYTTQKTP